MRLEPRTEAARSVWAIAPLVAVVASFVVAALLALLGGASPFAVCAAVSKGAAGTHFAPGSMAPKIEACIEFLEAGGSEAVITTPDRLGDAIAGRAGTHIVA